MEERNKWTTWRGLPARIAGPMTKLYNSAERFRAKWSDYLDDIDGAGLERQLEEPFRPSDWREVPDEADDSHRQAWQAVAVSRELRDLAYYGFALYETFFPAGSDLRLWLDGLPFGHRINLSWLADVGGVPHVPWGLIYRRPVPPAGSAVDPMEFLGLGFRISYTSHDVEQASKALGAPGRSHPAFLFYWGSDPDDAIGIEAAWQRTRWGAWPNQLMVPSGATPDAKKELLDTLSDPRPSPVTLLYVYCQASVGQGNDPMLRFGRDLSGQDEVRDTDFPQTPLVDAPLVFANACTTSSAGVYMTNDLEESFFKRGCRAFLGTETKVPIALASRFAAVSSTSFSAAPIRSPSPPARLWPWPGSSSGAGTAISAAFSTPTSISTSSSWPTTPKFVPCVSESE